MKTKITIYRPEELPEELQVDLPSRPTTAQLRELLRGPLRTTNYERVRVFWDGRYLDMFVDEFGEQNELPTNAAATEIYRNNWLTHAAKPDADPDELPQVYGPAVLFDRPVWF